MGPPSPRCCMKRAARRCCVGAPRIRNCACVMMRVKLWCPVRYSPIPASLRAPLTLFFWRSKRRKMPTAPGGCALCAMKTPWSARCKTAWSRKPSLRLWSMAQRCCPRWSGSLPSASRMPPSGCAPNRALRCRTCRRRSGWGRRFAARAVTLNSRLISPPSPGASCCKTRSPG